MFSRFNDATEAAASDSQGRALSLANVRQNSALKLKNGIKLFLFAFTLSLVASSCVKDDDIQCGDPLHSCDNIVIDEMGDG